MDLRKLNPELAKIAKDELFEDPGRIQEDLDAIKTWLAKQKHIKSRTDDQWLISFLRGCKYSLERTKEKLDNYYTMKTMIPELANGVDPFEPIMQELINAGIFVILPKPIGSNGPRVMLTRVGYYEASRFSVAEILKLTYLFSNVQLMEDDQSVVAGVMVIGDANKVGMGHMAQMTLSNVKKLVMTRQDALPLRQKGVHHVNNFPGLETVFNIFRSFLSDKNKKRFLVHGDLKDMYKYIPKEILPTEYGGDAGPIDKMIDEWKKKIESYKDWFADDVNYKTDESSRPGKPKTAEAFFGVEGSFRKLNID